MMGESGTTMSNIGSELTLDFKPTGQCGTGIVTVRLGQDPLAVQKLDITKASARGEFVESLANEHGGLDKADVERALLREAARLTERAATTQKEESALETDPLVAMPAQVRAEATAMLRDPKLVRIIVDDIAALGVVGEPSLSMTVYLIGTSRLLPKPNAAIVRGPTSSGKSFIIDRTATLFPPECIIRAHRITPQALYHMPKGSLVHRFVAAGERSRRRDDDAADATRALREMLSEGRLTKLITTNQNGEFVTVEIDQPGPIAYVESTTSQSILDEDQNRCIVLDTDERPEQTRRINMAKAIRKADPDAGQDVEAIIEKHHAAQRMLRQCDVVIPFAKRLAEQFPHERTDARRSFGHLLSVIEGVTLLHQFQRVEEPADGVTIMATPDDYAIARYLLARPMARSFSGGVSDAALRLLERLSDWSFTANGTFTTDDVAQRDKSVGNAQTIRAYFRSLTTSGYLVCVEEHRGNKPAVYRLAPDPPDKAASAGLPDVSTVCGDASVGSAPRRRVEAQMLGLQ